MGARWGLFVIPAAVATAGLFIAPQTFLLLQSLRPSLGLGRVGTGWTLANYARVFSDSYYAATLVRTIWISTLTTGGCLVIGYPLGYFLARTRTRARGFLTLLVIAPLLITVVVRSLGWIILLSDNGPVNAFLRTLGVTHGPVRFIYNQFGVVVALIHALLPMMVLVLIGVIQQIEPSLEEAAADLGAGRAETFVRVIVPLSLPGIAAGCMLVFGVATSVYTTTVMLGGGRVLTTPVQIGQEFFMTLNYPMAASLSVIIVGITLGLALIGLRISKAKYLETSI